MFKHNAIQKQLGNEPTRFLTIIERQYTGLYISITKEVIGSNQRALIIAIQSTGDWCIGRLSVLNARAPRGGERRLFG